MLSKLKKLWSAEATDQALHFGIGFFATIALTKTSTGATLAVLIVSALAFCRELWQHKGWPTGAGSWRDMAFWLFGIALGGTI